MRTFSTQKSYFKALTIVCVVSRVAGQLSATCKTALEDSKNLHTLKENGENAIDGEKNELCTNLNICDSAINKVKENKRNKYLFCCAVTKLNNLVSNARTQCCYETVTQIFTVVKCFVESDAIEARNNFKQQQLLQQF